MNGNDVGNMRAIGLGRKRWEHLYDNRWSSLGEKPGMQTGMLVSSAQRMTVARGGEKR
jgi:hypothetical protein